MLLESGVSIAGIQPELVLSLIIADAIFTRHGHPMVLTSVVDGEHMHGSLHYVGAAADARRPDAGAESLTTTLARELGENYDVILEDDHIHWEFQPKHGANPDAGSDDGEPERAVEDISGTDAGNEGSGRGDSVDSDGTGAEPDAPE